MKKETLLLLEKAKRSIHSAEKLIDIGDSEFAASRAYYAMFYIAEAMLNELNLRFRKHGGVHAAFGENFIKTGKFDQKYHRWLLDAFDKRITSDYGVELEIIGSDAKLMVDQAREFLNQAEHFLQ